MVWYESRTLLRDNAFKCRTGRGYLFYKKKSYPHRRAIDNPNSFIMQYFNADVWLAGQNSYLNNFWTTHKIEILMKIFELLKTVMYVSMYLLMDLEWFKKSLAFLSTIKKCLLTLEFFLYKHFKKSSLHDLMWEH